MLMFEVLASLCQKQTEDTSCNMLGITCVTSVHASACYISKQNLWLKDLFMKLMESVWTQKSAHWAEDSRSFWTLGYLVTKALYYILGSRYLVRKYIQGVIF
jgi:hypothetical protein